VEKISFLEILIIIVGIYKIFSDFTKFVVVFIYIIIYIFSNKSYSKIVCNSFFVNTGEQNFKINCIICLEDIDLKYNNDEFIQLKCHYK
jgi:hypothetical protein